MNFGRFLIVYRLFSSNQKKSWISLLSLSSKLWRTRTVLSPPIDVLSILSIFLSLKYFLLSFSIIYGFRNKRVNNILGNVDTYGSLIIIKEVFLCLSSEKKSTIYFINYQIDFPLLPHTDDQQSRLENSGVLHFQHKLLEHWPPQTTRPFSLLNLMTFDLTFTYLWNLQRYNTHSH